MLDSIWHLPLAYILGIFVVGPVVDLVRILDCIHADVIPGACASSVELVVRHDMLQE